MAKNIIEGIIVSDLRKIHSDKGDIFHILKKSHKEYKSFGEAYFSSVILGEKKGWKQHLRMTCNLVVPVGVVRFYIIDTRNGHFSKGNRIKVDLSPEKYRRLTIPPGLTFLFEGIEYPNIILNIADIEHDPEESINFPLSQFSLTEAFHEI